MEKCMGYVVPIWVIMSWVLPIHLLWSDIVKIAINCVYKIWYAHYSECEVGIS